MHPVSTMLSLLGLLALIVAATTDLKARTIPNCVVIAVAALGIGLQVSTHGLAAWVSLAAALAVFFPAALLAEADALGGGDAKLISAATLLVPPHSIMNLLLNIGLAGGVMSCGFIAARALRQPGALLLSKGSAAAAATVSVSRDAELMPYALAILAGTAISLFPEML